MSFKLYDSAGFTVTDLGYGVLIRANVAAVETFLQGNDASELRDGLESLEGTRDLELALMERATDGFLSEYFTNHGDDARRLIGERE